MKLEHAFPVPAEVVRKPSNSALEAAIGELAAEEVQCEEVVDVDEAPAVMTDSGVMVEDGSVPVTESAPESAPPPAGQYSSSWRWLPG